MKKSSAEKRVRRQRRAGKGRLLTAHPPTRSHHHQAPSYHGRHVRRLPWPPRSRRRLPHPLRSTRRWPSLTPRLSHRLPQGNGRKFESAKEFVCHLAWIMAGQPEGRCRCIKCNPEYKSTTTRGQTKLNDLLQEGTAEAMEERKKAVASAHAKKRNSALRTNNFLNEKVYLRPALS